MNSEIESSGVQLEEIGECNNSPQPTDEICRPSRTLLNFNLNLNYSETHLFRLVLRGEPCLERIEQDPWPEYSF